MDVHHKRTPITSEDPKKIDPFKQVPDVIEEMRQDNQGKLVLHKHVKGHLLGKGGFAQVYLTTLLPSKEKYALKIVAKSSLQKQRAKAKLQTEINIHQELNHEHIVRFSHCFEDNLYTYLMLELCSNNSMSDMMNQRKRITEPECRYYLSQLVSSLQYLHRHLIIHRDLKLGNLFIDKYMRLKVGDFGLAAKLERPDQKRMTVCGTPNYIAPELLQGKNGHSFEVDIWSTGIILYTFLVGKPPFQCKDVKSTYKKILANVYSFPEGFIVSSDARNLVAMMLQQRPEHRPSLQTILVHPFFTGPNAFVPSSLPVSSLKEIPILTAPPTMQYPSKTIPGMMDAPVAGPSKGHLESMQYGNENNPNAANMIPSSTNAGANARHEEPLSHAFGSRRPSTVSTTGSATTTTTNRALYFDDVEEVNLHDANHDQGRNNRPVLEERPSSAAAVSRSISARMRTALAQKTTGNSSAAPIAASEKFSVQATMAGQSENNSYTHHNGNDMVTNSKPLTSKMGAPARYSSNTRPTVAATTAGKFDIFVDNQLDDATTTGRTAGKSSATTTALSIKTNAEISSRSNRYETRQQQQSKQQQHVPVASLGKILDDMKLQDENTSPNQPHHHHTAGQKRIDISTKDNNTAYSPTDTHSRPKRVKEAWNTHTTPAANDNNINNKQHKYQDQAEPVITMTVSTPPEQVIRSEDVQQLRLNTLETMHDMLNDSISMIDGKTPTAAAAAAAAGARGFKAGGDLSPLEPMAKTWVVRYVDYTTKYGLGFLFNNGMAGVYFNDSTKMVMSSNGMVLQYVERVRRETSFGSENSSQRYSIDHYPAELQKKVTLMKHFRNYLLEQERLHGHEKTIGMEDDVTDTNAFKAAFTKEVPSSHHVGLSTTTATSKLGETSSVDDDCELPFLKKWIRTKHAVLFRLSNRTVQVVFYDKSEVLLSSEARMITYVNKQGDRSEHALNDVMLAGRVDISKRLKYTKDIMHRLINTTTNTAQPSGTTR